MNLKQLAASLGLSQTTVSRALNGYPEVREATRLRVVAAAEAAGYRPNSRAQKLATGRAMAVGHVISPTGGNEMVNPILADFVAGAAETYAKAGYDLLLSMAEPGNEIAAYRALAAAGSVDGIIVHGPSLDDPRIPVLKELGLPFMVHGRAGDTPASHAWLDIANQRAFKRATDLLLDLGHTRIGFVNGNEQLDFAVRRRAGYQEGLRARGLPIDPDLMSSDEMTERYGYQRATTLLDSDNPPTAFLVSSMISAFGIQRAAGERGLQLGQDLSLITHDDRLSYLSPDGEEPIFTATRSSVRAAGRRCAEIILTLIEDPESPPIQELWDVDLSLGQTTGPAPQRGA